MELKFSSFYKPLTVEIGDEKVVCRINVTVNKLLELSDTCTKAEQQVKALEKLENEAKNTKNAAKMKKVNEKIADVLEVVVKAGIGEESYNEIVAACGAGGPVEKSDCNIVMIQVFAAIYEAVLEQKEESKSNKAAHYLAEVANAQAKSDTED